MNIETSRNHSHPRLIIEERLYTRLVALAERARAQAPELADRLLVEIERADLRAPERDARRRRHARLRGHVP